MQQIYQDWHIALTDKNDQDEIPICSRHKNIAILSDTNMCISSSPEIMKIMKVNTLKNTEKGARFVVLMSNLPLASIRKI